MNDVRVAIPVAIHNRVHTFLISNAHFLHPAGQWASTRPDMFPRDFCTVLERLQTGAPSHPPPLSRAAIEAAFGLPLDELFEEFEDEPVASGSIAQIHRAKLHPELAARFGVTKGKHVAVKVRLIYARDCACLALLDPLTAH